MAAIGSSAYKLEDGLTGPSSICRASDGGYYIMGGSDPYSTEFKPFFLLKINGSGEEIWSNEYPETGFLFGSDVVATQEGDMS